MQTAGSSEQVRRYFPRGSYESPFTAAVHDSVPGLLVPNVWSGVDTTRHCPAEVGELEPQKGRSMDQTDMGEVESREQEERWWSEGDQARSITSRLCPLRILMRDQFS